MHDDPSPEVILGGQSTQSRVRRQPQVARYDQASIYQILDAATLCSVGVLVDGAPLVLTTIFCRDEDSLIVHGSQSALLLRSMLSTPKVCISVTLFDGLIVARSAFNSSMAYRSVVLFGRAELIEDPVEAERALDRLTDAVLPGRTSEVRRPLETELARTSAVRFWIDEASAKVSLGPPSDELEDLEGDTWAGVVPVMTNYGAPIAAVDGRMGREAIELPASVRRLFKS